MIWLDEGGRQRDTRLIAPPPSLRGVVEHFWTHQRLPEATWRVVPDLSAHVIFYLAGSTAVCRIVGVRSTYCDIDVSRRDLTIGVRLRPGALPQLIRNASQLSDRSESLVPGEQVGQRIGSGTVAPWSLSVAEPRRLETATVRFRTDAFRSEISRSRATGATGLAPSCCGGRLRLIVLIEARAVIQRTLRHLGLPTEVRTPRPVRDPPIPFE